MAKLKAAKKKLQNNWVKPVAILILPLIGIIGMLYVMQKGSFDIFSFASTSGEWERHEIDNMGNGADGVKLGYVNSDFLLDVVTGWEQSGDVRVYLNPGPNAVTAKWPQVQAGKIKSVEDALPLDINKDGNADVISFPENSERTMKIHIAPALKRDYFDGSKWTTQDFPPSKGVMNWMFGVTAQIDGKNGKDIIAGGKGEKSMVGWFESPADPSQLDQWKWHPLTDVEWAMTLKVSDMDGDKDLDVLVSQRYHETIPSVLWIKNPGGADTLVDARWTNVKISGTSKSVRFSTLGDLDKDGLVDVVTADSDKIIYSRRLDATGANWQEKIIKFPNKAGKGKGIAVADVNLDGKNDLVITFVGAEGNLLSSVWMEHSGDPVNGSWSSHTIASVEGVKFDVVEMIDLDNDGDKDFITTEEVDDLGVIWYENPTR